MEPESLIIEDLQYGDLVVVEYGEGKKVHNTQHNSFIWPGRLFPIQVGADLCIGMRRKCMFYGLYDFQGSDIPDCTPFLACTVFNSVKNRSDQNWVGPDQS